MAGRTDVSIRVEGYPALRRKMRRFAPDAAAALAATQREIGETVRDMAAHEAAARGYNDTGDLIAGLRAQARGTTGSIRDTARHGGYPYPARLEYEGGGAGAFIRPAIDQASEWITRKMNEAVALAAEKFNGGGIT